MILKTGNNVWVTGYGLRVTGYGLRVTGYGLRVKGNGLRGKGNGLRGKGSGLRIPYPVSRIPKLGFTLIEVMVTTAILSLGVVLVYNAFFISLDSFNYCSDYLAVAPLMDEKIQQAQEQLSSQGLSALPPGNGQFRVNNKEFNWYLKCVPVMGAQDLFKIDLAFSWQQGSRNKRLLRVAYAIYKKE